MQKLSGLILDAYDDRGGEVLRDLYPRREDVPEIVKQAYYVTPEERRELPADVFALELVDGPTTLRKFACVDAGNTMLSVGYFLKTASKLPLEAQKTAAANLLNACDWYGLEPPEELQKVAIGVLGMMNAAMVAPSVVNQAKQNTQTAKASGGIVNPSALTFKPPT